ncbi:hypothetical protein [Streptomyces peucetius]|uniref:Lipoprotein n=1 Tax=Streptomyces peucetius TaxID=1950 RepID=A0ABY6ICK4_STRPE|nr:hypothetical protein [Streptomyces peucetius]UYQ64730.1 hypothetical protein OGH68_26950 [Streptomyces peucetius]
MGRTGTTRRRALLATGVAAAGLLTGCSSDTPVSRRTRDPAADRARAEAALRVRLVGTSTALRDEYDAVIARHPALAGRLTPLRAEVAAHVVALAGPASEVTPSSAPASPSASVPAPAAGPASPSPDGPTPAAASAGASAPVPDEPAAALKSLAAAERRTSDSHTAALADAEPELARLLASVAAAGAAHEYLLTKGDAR